jgi:hypothetical protein
VGRAGALISARGCPDHRVRSPTGCAEMFLVSGDQPMRVLAILARALLLAGCEGDRIKNVSMNERQAQPQSTVLT